MISRAGLSEWQLNIYRCTTAAKAESCASSGMEGDQTGDLGGKAFESRERRYRDTGENLDWMW